MKNILKYLIAILLVPLFFQSCKNEADRNWTTSSQTFKLYDTTLGSNTLYPSMANNTFSLTWDNTLSSASYTVQMSTTEDFAKPITVGTSTTNNYNTNIASLNTIFLQAGLSPYASQKVFLRIVSGTNYSNSISFNVTPYPTSVPVITAPTSGTVLVLDRNKADQTATTITWTDYATYGVPVTYLVEVAPKGSTNFVTLGSVTDAKSLVVTHKAFNDAVLKAGLVANVAADLDIRVTATTKSTGGTITKVSNIVTIKVTPYVAFKNLYLVGDATSAGWSNNNNNQPLFRDPATPTKFHFVGNFGTSMFKLLEVLGQWQPQWGTNSAGTVDVNDGTGSDPGTFNVPSAGYYKFTIDIVAKTYTFAPAADANYYGQIGLIGSAYEATWTQEKVLTQSATDPHQWYVLGVTLKDGEAKFRADASWSVNWGANTELSGIGTPGGPNIPVSAGTYNVYFDDMDGSYLFIKQ